MREHSLRLIGTAVQAACASGLYIRVSFLCATGLMPLRAQTLPLPHGERVDYDPYFKWGLVVSKTGLVAPSVKESEYQGAPSWRYDLLFRFAGVIGRIFRMRDTMDYHCSKGPRLLPNSRCANEGDCYPVGNLQFEYQGSSRIDIHSHRHILKKTKIDTMLVVRGCVFNMLGTTIYLRSLDWRMMNYGAGFPFMITIGRELMNVCFRYTGQQIVEHKEAKFRTCHFYIDIYDEAFSQAREAAGVQIGDNEGRIPVEIRAKLKIGTAKACYEDSYNLHAPLIYRIAMQKK